jgi:hypothetical protein
VEHKTLLCWLATAHIGAAYKNQEGSLASLFRRCSISDVTTLNIRNGNSISAAVPVQHLDPVESEEWSATFTLSLICLIFLPSLYIVFPSSFIPGYRSRGPGSFPGATRFTEMYWVRNRVQPREHN